MFCYGSIQQPRRIAIITGILLGFLGSGTLNRMGRVLRRADIGFWILVAGTITIPFLSAIYFHSDIFVDDFVDNNVETSTIPIFVWFASMFFLYNMSIARLTTSWTGASSKPIRSFLRLIAGRIIFTVVMAIVVIAAYLAYGMLSSITSFTVWYIIFNTFLGGLAILFFIGVFLSLPIMISWTVAQANPDLPRYPWNNFSVAELIGKRTLDDFRFLKFYQILVLYGLIPFVLANYFFQSVDYQLINALGVRESNSNDGFVIDFEMKKSFLYLMLYPLQIYVIDILGIVTGMEEGESESAKYTEITEKKDDF